MTNYFIELIDAMRRSWATIYQGLILVLLNHLGVQAMDCLAMVPTRDLRAFFVLLLGLTCLSTVLGGAIVCWRLWGFIKAPVD